MPESPRLSTVLAEALDALTATDRRVLAEAAKEARSPWFARLLDGLVVQAAANEARRQALTLSVLAPFEAENRRELDDLEATVFGPLPRRAEGVEWWPEGPNAVP